MAVCNGPLEFLCAFDDWHVGFSEVAVANNNCIKLLLVLLGIARFRLD